jgi:arylsulfatase
VAFNAPHAPLQPLEQDYRKYLGRYDAGWDAIRAARVAKQKQIGLLPTNLEESPRPEHVRAWDQLTPERKAWEAKRMSAYAGLIDRIDQEMGRLISDLEKNGELANTVILFVSDNGACPYDRGRPEPDAQPFDPKTSWSDSTGWAWARNSPFRYYKQNQFEGGISTPAILHWPAGLKQKPGSVIDTPAHLVDVLPTFAELAGAKVPETFPGRELTPLAGTSLAPVIAGGDLKARPPIHLLFAADRGLRDGDWKIVSFKSEPWGLYNLRTDRTELHNVAAQHPDIVQRMVKQWTDMAEHVLMTPAKERAPVSTEVVPHTNREWTDYDKPLTEGKVRKGKKQAATLPRARKGTKLTVEGDQLVLTCTGEDPGLAFNDLHLTAPGPYVLQFKLQSHATGSAELYWTTDAETILPKGKHLDFDVKHDGEWHEHTIRIDETKAMHALRLDPCGSEGEVRLEGLTLKNAEGKVLAKWP